jgi:small-conductance mechanosensitive channel
LAAFAIAVLAAARCEAAEQAAGSSNAVGLLPRLNAVIDLLSERLALVASGVTHHGSGADILTTMAAGKGAEHIANQTAIILLVALAAIGLTWPISRWLGRLRARLDGVASGGSLVGVIMLDAFATVLFLPLVAIGYAVLVEDGPPQRLVVIATCLTFLLGRGAMAASDWVFGRMTSEEARRLRPWASATGVFLAEAWLVATFLENAGLGEGPHLAVCLALGSLGAVLAMACAWRTAPLARARLTQLGDRLSLALARGWIAAACGMILTAWLVWAFSFLTFGERTLATYATVIAIATLALAGLRDWRGGLAVAVALPLLALLWIRDAEILLFSWTTVSLTVTVAAAWLALRATRIVFDGMAPERGTGELGEESAQPRSRFETLLPLIHVLLVGVILLVTLSLVFSAIGIDTGPLLAGAGVIGLAIGFGAQTLVRDIITGLFFLFEDAFRIGEYVDVGNNKRGEVEAVSPRSLRLRHHRGAIHRVPFGEIRILTNHSRDWVVDKILLQVEYGTDVDALRKLVKRVGQDIMDDPEVGPLVLAPLKSQGIAEFGESGLVVRLKVTTRPSEQFIVRREVMRRLHIALKEAGVAFAHPKRFVSVVDGGQDAPRMIGQAVIAPPS